MRSCASADTVVALLLAMTWGGHTSTFSRRNSPELCIIYRPHREQRAQGRPGGRCTRGRRAKEICASAMTTGTGGDHTGLPCAVVYGLYAISSVNHPVCHRRRPRCEKHRRQLGAKDLGRQDHATSPSARDRRSSVSALTSTASRLVTIAIRPSASEAGCANHTPDSGFWKTEIFSRERIDKDSHGSHPTGKSVRGSDQAVLSQTR